MIFKSMPPFLLFLFIIAGFVIDGLTYSAFAASIPTTKSEVISSPPPKHSPSNKKNILLKHVSHIEASYILADLIKPIEFIKPVPKVPHNPALKNKTSPHSPVMSNTLKDLGDNFLIENEDNILLQDSLIALSNTKKFLHETDLMLHDLTENIIALLKLDQLVQNNKFLIQQSTLLNTQLEHKNTTDLENINVFELLRNILIWSNLFYLLAIIFFYSILRAIIKFLFLQKQQIYRSSRH